MNIVKNILKFLLPSILYNFISDVRNRRVIFKGREHLDKKILKYLDFQNGFFIELGANDGISESNTYFFERFRNWKGVLIEPILHNYLSCKKNRSEKNKFFCNACVSFKYKKKYVELLYVDLMTISLSQKKDVKNINKHFNTAKRFTPIKEKILFAAVA